MSQPGKTLVDVTAIPVVEAAARVIPIPADGTLVIKNRAERNRDSSGYKLQFKQLDVVSVTYEAQTIDYSYDAISRLLSANYVGGDQYSYTFDLAGNRTSETINTVTTSYTYNAANQITNTGFAYDNNGNMLNDGVNAYVWDRANRLLSMGGHSYAYDGDG